MHGIFYIFIASIVLRRSNIRLYKYLSFCATNHLLFHFSRFVRLHRRKLFSSIGIMSLMCGLIFFAISAVTLWRCEAVSNSVGNHFNFLDQKTLIDPLNHDRTESTASTRNAQRNRSVLLILFL